MSKKIESTIESLIAQTVEQNGFELADVEFKKEDGQWVLTIFIYNEQGVKIEDCELISRIIEPIIDEADPIEMPYALSVSSLGLDRTIVKVRDFERNINKTIIVRLYAQIQGVKEYKGVLVACDEKTITLKDVQSAAKSKRKPQIKPQLTLAYDEFASAKLYIDFGDF